MDLKVAEGVIRRLVERARRNGVRRSGAYAEAAAIQARARQRSELAREIGEAMRSGDRVLAEHLVEKAGREFGHSAMLAMVRDQARQERMAAAQPYHPDEEWD